MLFSKKVLKKKKKTTELLCSAVENERRYYADNLAAKSPDEFTTYLYTRLTRPDFNFHGVFPRATHRARYGTLLVHIDSVFTQQSNRRHIKNNLVRFEYKTYWESLLKEELNFLNVPILAAAKDWGLHIRGISTTPIQYREVIEKFLERHQIKHFFNSIIQPASPWKSESVYLKHILRLESNSTNGMCYWWFDKEQYPKIYGSSLYTFF